MSLQDDIFDLEEELKGTPMAKSFDRVKHAFYEVEQENDELLTQNVHLKSAYLESTLKKYRTG